MSDFGRKGLGAGLLFGSLLLCGALLLYPSGRKETLTVEGGGRNVAISPVPVFEKGTVQVTTADAEELTQQHGIGETLAAVILEERAQNGPFFYPEDLTQVKGIGPAKLAGFLDMLDLRMDEGGEN